MPELPDLEAFSGNLTKKFAGETLAKIKIVNKSNLKTSGKDFKTLEGQELKKIYREGKELRFQFKENILGLHLMLNGNLYLFDKSNTHTHTIIELDRKSTRLNSSHLGISYAVL